MKRALQEIDEGDVELNMLSNTNIVRTEPKISIWEYTISTFSILRDEGTLTEWLDRFGEDGWELVSVVKDHLEYTCFFKRKLK